MNGHLGRFLGKYRGQVSDANDPLGIGRIRARVPDVFGNNESGWALPCFAFAGPGVGLFAIPPVGAWVWMEFEYGEPENPIWTGCFYPQDPTAVPKMLAELAPVTRLGPQQLVLKTKEWLVTVDVGKVSIASLAAAVPRTRLELTANTVKLTNEASPGAPSPPSATVELVGNTVRINGSALEVS